VDSKEHNSGIKRAKLLYALLKTG